MLNSIKNFFDFSKKKSLQCIQHAVIPCDSYKELMRLWHWDKEPDLSYLGKQPLTYHYPEDLNDRELHDAETLMAIACNIGQTAILEIGTSIKKQKFKTSIKFLLIQQHGNQICRNSI